MFASRLSPIRFYLHAAVTGRKAMTKASGNLCKNYWKQDASEKDAWLTVHSHCSLANNHHKEKLSTLQVLKNNWQ